MTARRGVVVEGVGLDEAAAGYRRVLTLRPGFAEVHNNLGAVLANQGKPHEAVAEYRHTLECSPRLVLGAAIAKTL